MGTMTALVLTQEYRDITGDINTAAEAISARIEEATELVEEFLQRRLRFGTYTDELEIWDSAYAYPLVTPIVSVPSGSQYLIDAGGIRSHGRPVVRWRKPALFDEWRKNAVKMKLGLIPPVSVVLGC